MLSSIVLYSLLIAQVHALLKSCLRAENSSSGLAATIEIGAGGLAQQYCAEWEYHLFKITGLLGHDDTCYDVCRAHADHAIDRIQSDQLLGVGLQCNPVGWICFSLGVVELTIPWTNNSNYAVRTDQGMFSISDNPGGIQMLAVPAPLECQPAEGHGSEQTLQNLQKIYQSSHYELRHPLTSRYCRCTLGITFGALPEDPQEPSWGCLQRTIFDRLTTVISDWLSGPGQIVEEGFPCDDQSICDCGSLTGPMRKVRCLTS
jgi:hypothetical protein